MFEGIKLPRKLQRHVSNLSTTIQVLLAEVILYIENVEDRERSEAGKLDYALKNKRATELLTSQLQDYLHARKLPSNDAAIGVAAVAGRTTREMAEFYGMDQVYAMRRLCAIRKDAAKHKPRRERLKDMVQMCFTFFQSATPNEDETDVMEIFAEAQRRC